DECAERVKHQEETHGKAEEDCVEECKSISYTEHERDARVKENPLTVYSLPYDALRDPMRGA
ncbi:UNVERIFIED_CONTAM: hypothetical protein NY603_37180, partial [Bacteroidetes bacterium 56_B9]